MPHLRNRYLTTIIQERAKSFPVIAIQGARQVGKSAMVRELLPRLFDAFRYETFDQPSILRFATSNPESFLEGRRLESGILAIDEAQKVPAVFDGVKYIVDQSRRPGQFILLGSTEFSKRTLIRESLTGRVCNLRLFPFTMAEAFQLPNATGSSALTVQGEPRATRAQLIRHLASGGMPGAFHIRDDAHREIYFSEWMDRVIMRDLMLIPKLKINPDLAREILTAIATMPSPSRGAIAKALKIDPRRVRTHIEALETLFVVHRLDPHVMGTGQPMYFLCDVGLASFLGADFERQLQTWVLQELLACAQWRQDIHERIFFYRTPKGSVVHFILESKKSMTALKIIAKESVTELDIKALQALNERAPSRPLTLLALGPVERTFAGSSVRMVPWESLV